MPFRRQPRSCTLLEYDEEKTVLPNSKTAIFSTNANSCRKYSFLYSPSGFALKISSVSSSARVYSGSWTRHYEAVLLLAGANSNRKSSPVTIHRDDCMAADQHCSSLKIKIAASRRLLGSSSKLLTNEPVTLGTLDLLGCSRNEFFDTSVYFNKATV